MGKARGLCRQCKKWISILLPFIRKKLVYLDQSFLSAACLEADKESSKIEIRILSTIKSLKEQQKIFVVISDIHSREASAIPDEHIENRKALWAFQNNLADGNISNDWDDVFVAQWRRMLTSQDSSDSYPASDIGIDNPHQFQIGIRIQSTNNWRQRLHRAHAQPHDAVNEDIRRIIELQSENVRHCKNGHDYLNYVRELWCKDIRQGIDSWQRQQEQRLIVEQVVKELESGRIQAMPPYETPAPFCRSVGDVVEELDKESALQRWLELLDGDAANLIALIRIQTAFEAELLRRWRTSCPPTNPETFNIGFGLSCRNDIDHVSTFIPYVDAMTTDNGMRKLCKSDIVDSELKRFSCKIFSKDNYEEFESWLKELEAEPVTQ